MRECTTIRCLSSAYDPPSHSRQPQSARRECKSVVHQYEDREAMRLGATACRDSRAAHARAFRSLAPSLSDRRASHGKSSSRRGRCLLLSVRPARLARRARVCLCRRARSLSFSLSLALHLPAPSSSGQSSARRSLSVATPAAASIPLGSSPALVLALARPRPSRASHHSTTLCPARATVTTNLSLSVARARTLSLARPCSGGERSHGRSLGLVVEAEWERTLPKGVVGSGGTALWWNGGRAEVSGRRWRGERERERARASVRGADDPSSRAMPLNWIPAPFSRQSDAGRAVGTAGVFAQFFTGPPVPRVPGYPSDVALRSRSCVASVSRTPSARSATSPFSSRARLVPSDSRSARNEKPEEGRQMLEPNLQARRLPRGSTLAAATRVQRGSRPAAFVTSAPTSRGSAISRGRSSRASPRCTEWSCRGPGEQRPRPRESFRLRLHHGTLREASRLCREVIERDEGRSGAARRMTVRWEKGESGSWTERKAGCKFWPREEKKEDLLPGSPAPPHPPCGVNRPKFYGAFVTVSLHDFCQ